MRCWLYVYAFASPCARTVVVGYMKKEGARATAEALELDASLQTEGATMVAEERARQMLAVSADADPQKEAGRIRERHTHCLVSLQFCAGSRYER